jgi:hypothetical protein
VPASSFAPIYKQAAAAGAGGAAAGGADAYLQRRRQQEQGQGPGGVQEPGDVLRWMLDYMGRQKVGGVGVGLQR